SDAGVSAACEGSSARARQVRTTARNGMRYCGGHCTARPQTSGATVTPITQNERRLMFETTIAGSLPKPEWLAETHKLWPQWRSQGPELAQAKLDATLLWIKAQEDAGLSVIGDGEQSRQHFVHGFLERVEGIDFEHKVEMGIRADRYKAMVP